MNRKRMLMVVMLMRFSFAHVDDADDGEVALMLIVDIPECPFLGLKVG